MTLAGTLWRGKRLIAACMALFLALGGANAFRGAAPYYSASSVVLLETSRRAVTDIRNIVTGLSDNSSALNSQIAIMRSRGPRGKVVDRPGLTKDPEFNAELRPPSALARVQRGCGDVLRYMVDKPAAAAAEAVRNLRTSVPGEGKTSVSFALAQNLAMMGKSVLLIEGDLRRRVFDNYLAALPEGQKGLAGVLADTAPFDDAVIHDARSGTDILLGDRARANAADIFSSARLPDEMRARYDHVLVDTPPVLVVPDVRVIARLSDAVLFVVRWDNTTEAQVREAMRMFDTVGQQVTGPVLNQIDPEGMEKYGYGGTCDTKCYTE